VATDSAVSDSPVSVTMRTPGSDPELAIGFLLTEGILRSVEQVDRIRVCGGGNTVWIHLKPNVDVDLDRLSRHFYTSSSCGVCGKTAIDAVNVYIRHQLEPDCPVVSPDCITSLPNKLREEQAAFDRTGGLHASGLFDAQGNLLRLHEDVGRHNALDKLIGAQWFEDETVFQESIVVVSGRVSFELVQKSLVAGIPILVAVGAPSSLAVKLAVEHNMTLIGFTRGQRFNVYSGFHRIQPTSH
jgi:FdhD protein